MESVNQSLTRFIDINDVSRITTLGKSTIRLWEALNKFPKSVKLSQNKRVWLESQVNQWMTEISEQSLGGQHE